MLYYYHNSEVKIICRPTEGPKKCHRSMYLKKTDDSGWPGGFIGRRVSAGVEFRNNNGRVYSHRALFEYIAS